MENLIQIDKSIQDINNKINEKKMSNENTIIINSLNRDWYNDTNSNPYSFKVEFNGSNNANIAVINEYYKNITSISIPTLIIPNNIQDLQYHSNAYIRPSTNPYLLINLDNITKSGRGTNKYLDDTLGLFIPNEQIDFSNNYKSVLFINQSYHVKKYYPSPLQSINDLIINITDNLGNNLISNDVLSIKGIYVNNEPLVGGSNDNLIIRTNSFFTQNEFEIRDKILIKNFEFHNMSFEESYQFNEFINRNSGHQVLNISKSNSSKLLYDQIEIQIPKNISRITGNASVESWFTNFMTKTLDSSIIINNKGKLINANKQSHIILKFETEEKIIY